MIINYKRNAALIVSIIAVVLFSSCNNDDSGLLIGSDFIEKTTDIIEVDSFSVELSTVLIDSVVTSNLSNMLSGFYIDNELGEIRAKSYLQFGLPSNFGIEKSDIYDSITLVLPYSDYYCGDTNTIQTLSVYRLSESLEFPDNQHSYYNITQKEYYNTPIGQFTFYPRPKRDSIIEIRLSDDIGLDFFYKVINNSTELSSNDDFQDYFKGIAITSDDMQSNAVIGFEMNDNLKIQLYTSRRNEELEEYTYKFPVSNTHYQFNQIIADRTGTAIENLIDQKEDINSYYTNDKSFIQGGAGIITKVMFPYFNNIIFGDNDLILSAELRLMVSKESDIEEYPDLIYYTTNIRNESVAAGTDDSGVLIASELNFDDIYNTNTYYSFDLTDFIKGELADDYFDNEKGLLITLSDNELSTTLKKMIFDGNNNYKNRPVLKITYLKN